uniref:Uncharacterized protein n=1 Tax=Cacopsylla melanoneura TaxID=428564 RepID=A0A8D8ZBN0_9HEMI
MALDVIRRYVTVSGVRGTFSEDCEFVKKFHAIMRRLVFKCLHLTCFKNSTSISVTFRHLSPLLSRCLFGDQPKTRKLILKLQSMASSSCMDELDVLFNQIGLNISYSFIQIF